MSLSRQITCIGGMVLAGVVTAGSTATPTLQESMLTVVAPQAQVIWNVSNAAFDDNGNVEKAKMKAADWAQIGAAAQQIKVTASALLREKHIAVAMPGAKIQDEGNGKAATAAMVSGYIDANPEGFRQAVRRLEVAGDKLVKAAATRNAAELTAVANSLDQVCEDCHMKFWYPELKKR